MATTRQVLAAAAIALAVTIQPARAWEQWHGDAANTGFVDTVTLPARDAFSSVFGIGPIAPGAGPVIGPDGTVYLATTDGALSAFMPHGALKWRVWLSTGYQFRSSPAVSVRGDVIYVVGTRVERDHRGGTTVPRSQAMLFRYRSDGVLLSQTPFPPHEPPPYGMTTTASPVLSSRDGSQVIFIPALYFGFNGFDRRLLAYNELGTPMFDQLVTSVNFGDVTGFSSSGLAFWCLMFLCSGIEGGAEPILREPDELDPAIQPPMASAGVFGSQNPIVVVSDHYQSLVGFSFSTNSGFREVFRKHLVNGDALPMSSPIILRDGHSVMAAHYDNRGWLMFAGPGAPNWTELAIPRAMAPTLLADGRVFVISRDGRVTSVLTHPERAVSQTGDARGHTIAPAAASCTHIFVSTTRGLTTLDAATLGFVAQFPIAGGGLSPPAIAPNGTVYAVAQNILLVFPPPRHRPSDTVTPHGCVPPAVFPGALPSGRNGTAR